MFDHVAAIVLAAGKGTRMQSMTTNKVALPLAQKPMISYTIDNLKKTGIKNIIVVVGFAAQSVKKILKDQVVYAHQTKQLGTGHAVKTGLSKVPAGIKEVLSVYGDDSAFYPPDLIRKFVSHHHRNRSIITVLTINKSDPTGLGRIIRDQAGNFQAIVEEKAATPSQKQITEINTGLYCFDRDYLVKNIGKIKKNPITQEIFITDLISLAVSQNAKVEAMFWHVGSVWFGVNNPKELKEAQAKMMASR
jgi:bifunctional N-acetylglucosamine-1-phosphate-uridyltransferase/glucosamine-1-phosphate-acetyltransferase GlmU-like protein